MKQFNIIFVLSIFVWEGSWGKLNSKIDTFDSSLIEVLDSSGYGDVSWVASSHSIKSVLSEIYLATRGSTRQQLSKSLGLSEDETIAKEQIKLNQFMLYETPSEGVTWKSANMLLIKDSFTLNPSYVSELSTLFDTNIESSNFEDSLAVENSVNSWVANKTGNLITQLLSPGDIGPTSLMILLNAVHFKGNWKYSFMKKATEQKCFYTKPDDCKMMDMMIQERQFKYSHDKQLGAKLLMMPYNDTRYSMMIVLPEKYDGLKDIINNLSKSNISESINNLEYEYISIDMPKFTTKFKANLRSPLEKIGLESIFQDSANFSGMTETSGVFVSEIIHQAYISVSEEGTEAAAATGAIMARNLDSESPEYIAFNVDHPFLYFIMYNNTQVLFAGQFIN